ncbi:MAG TPA: hypothetical protein VJY15_02480 [Candidatus Acidoferrum sp.]|nr:hypothetical protein [Candidatus Acidoferrum sp.]
MPNRKLLPGLLVIVALSLAGTFAYLRYKASDPLATRNEMLAHMPASTNAVVFLDLAALRTSPFLAQLFAWAPRPAPDEDYAQFMQATGFNYERDLDRMALAVSRSSNGYVFLVIADGRFDHRKIEAYARRSGKSQARNSATIFSIAPSGTSQALFFTFLREDRMAWTNDPSAAALFWQPEPFAAEWREHYVRLAGTPLFAVIRQDSVAASALAQQAPGGFRSPQLAALLAQLQWISIGAKPDGNLLRVVAEGECKSEATMRQLNDILTGILVLAQGALNGADTRKALDPQLREGYLELLQSADVQKVDRGSSKSVRVVFDVTPKLLQAARGAGPPVGTAAPAGQPPTH